MKKILMFGLALGFVSSIVSTASAYDEARDSKYEPTLYQDILENKEQIFKNNEDRLTEAIHRRQRNVYKTHIVSDAEYKTPADQRRRHIYSRMRGQVNERSTGINRQGEFKDVPYYQFRRQFSRNSMKCVNTFKTNVRNRAINYYLEGGNGDSESVCANAISGKDQVVERIPVWHDEYNTITPRKIVKADITSSIRRAQKNMFRNYIKTPTGYQKTSKRIRTVANPYANPFTNYSKNNGFAEDQHRVNDRRIPARADTFSRGFMFWQDRPDGTNIPDERDETFDLEIDSTEDETTKRTPH